jgi:hypothetical protein
MLVFDVSTLIVDWIDTETAATLYTWFGLIGPRRACSSGLAATRWQPGVPRPAAGNTPTIAAID